MLKTYTELIRIPTFEERFEYLRTGSKPGVPTFANQRYLNQAFYRSKQWRQIRDKIVIRDSLGGDSPMDLAFPGRPIAGGIVIHHLNEITPEEVEHSDFCLVDPENLVATSWLTHKAIHYGDINTLPREYVPRSPYDTCPWRLGGG